MPRRKSMKTATNNGTRLEQLESLAGILALQIDGCAKDFEEGPKLLPQLSKQYRETIKEIEELKGMEGSDDEIAKILSGRKADGKPDTVR